MKLKIRYENMYQTVELDAAATHDMWVSLSLEGEGLSDMEKEQKIQEAFETQFNRPEYNNWHKYERHHGYSMAKPEDDESEDDFDSSEPLMKEVRDDRIFRQDEIQRSMKDEYEDVCQRVRSALAKKPDWAEMFIAVRINGVSVDDYAASIGADASNISHKLARAEKKLREIFEKRQK